MFTIDRYSHLLKQLSSSESFNIKAKSSFLRNTEKSTSIISALVNHNKYIYEIRSESGSNSEIYSQENTYKLTEVGIKLRQNIEFNPSSELLYLVQQSIKFIDASEINSIFFPTDGYFRYKYKLNYQWSLTTSASFNTSTPTAQEMNHLYYYNSFNSIAEYSIINSPYRKLDIGGRVNYMNILHNLDAYLELEITPYAEVMKRSYNFKDNLIISTPQASRYKSYSINLRLKKFISRLKTIMIVKPSFTSYSFNNTINGDSYLNRIQDYSLRSQLEFKTGKYLLYEVKLSYLHRNYYNGRKYLNSDLLSTAISITTTIGEFSTELSFSGLYNDIYRFNSILPAMEIELEYNWELKNKSDLSFYISAFNLLNRRETATEFISDQVVSSRILHLIPFHVLGGVAFYF